MSFQERKEERTSQRIEQMLARRAQLEASGALTSPQVAREVDAAVADLERSRDLSRCIVHLDMVRESWLACDPETYRDVILYASLG